MRRDAKPGQFVQIRVSDSRGPLLRRPFSIHKINKDSLTFIYHIVGTGTQILSEAQKGIALDIIGPLGNGFSIDKNKTAVLIAGGCGSAPLYCLEEELKKNNIESHFFMGATTQSLLLCGSDFAKIGTKLYISTDDGSCGEKCTVSALYSSYIKTLDPGKCVIYTCGPKAMMKAVSEIAEKNGIPCQASLEEYMACGIGACLGCVVETVNGNKRVCKDGPVFDSKDILWQ
jgi:dihydroorotate dehydrogenase electron transfer subunit